MPFDFRTLEPERTQWLETRVCYTGRGRAVFTDPPGEIEGPAEVTFARSGRARVRITPERVEPNRLSLHRGSSAGEYRRNGMRNPCASVEVRTDAGVYSSTTDRNFIEGGSFRAEVEQELEIRPLRSEFVAAGSAAAAFWVLPLTNFVTDDWATFRDYPELDAHPLRLLRTPAIPPELTGDDRIRAELIVHHSNRLLTFEAGTGIGLIEPRPGYGRRAERLKTKRSRNEFTAVAVGPAHVQQVVWEDATLFPIDLLAVLNLATGTRVGAPCVEFRDADGRLVRRCHIPFGAAKYRDAWATVGGRSCRNAIGELLTSAFGSRQFGRRPFRVVLHHARAVAERGTQETQFLTLCRAFETLCHDQGLRNHDLAALLTDAQRGLLLELLKATQQSIHDIGHGETDPRRRDALNLIEARVPNAARNENSFGLKVCELAGRFGLRDAAVLDPHFAAHPVRGSSTWAAVLSQLRGAATHEAYFDIDGRHDLWGIQRVKDHMHDLLLRVIWKLIGYTGPYQCPIPPVYERPSADWVTSGTSPKELGME